MKAFVMLALFSLPLLSGLFKISFVGQDLHIAAFAQVMAAACCDLT